MASILPFNTQRSRILYQAKEQKQKSNTTKPRYIAYYMQRDNRIHNNWAYIYAQNSAIRQNLPLIVLNEIYFNKNDPSATLRNLEFKIAGLKEVEQTCLDLNVSFKLINGHESSTRTSSNLINFLKHTKDDFLIDELVLDFNPLRQFRKLTTDLTNFLKRENEYTGTLNTTLSQVDAHNVVPVWVTSEKIRDRPFIIRPMITKHLDEFLVEYPEVGRFELRDQNQNEEKEKIEKTKIDWENYKNSFLNSIDASVQSSKIHLPGPNQAQKTLKNFIKNGLTDHNANRNNPTKDNISGLSPYFHHGHISPQQAIFDVKQAKDLKMNLDCSQEDIDKFIDEALTWREMADNFCTYSDNYDNFEGAPNWAKKSFADTRNDPRQYLYDLRQFENSQTHDKLWNAANNQMKIEGKMHGFLRMYWAKMILEWTRSPEEALEISIYLNDKYSLDGSDPNGYLGCMWSIVGSHDRNFRERKVTGKVRYMTYGATKGKFDVGIVERKYANGQVGGSEKDKRNNQGYGKKRKSSQKY